MNENMNELEQIIAELENFISTAERPKMFNKDMVLVKPEDIYVYLDEMRRAIPEEVKQANDVISRGNNIVQSAVREAEQYMADSKKQAEQLLNEQEVVVLAKQKADAIVQNAREQADAIKAEAEEAAELERADADRYAYQTLSHMEKVLKKGLDTVLQGKEELNVAPNSEK